MPNNSDVERNEKLFDALLKVAFEESIDREMEALPSSGELNKMYPRSAAMNKRFNDIINPPNKESAIKRVTRIAGRIAAVFAMFFTISTIALMSVEASRVFIFNTIFNVQDDHVVFDFGDVWYIDDDMYTVYRHEFDILQVAGFYYVSSHISYTRNTFVYENAYGNQLIFQQHMGTSLRIFMDNERREFTMQEFGGREFFVFTAESSDYFHTIMWVEGNDVMILSSTIDIDLLFDIAVNLTSE
ncbi:MAG: hypothetical protein FWF80_04110 [Defluviitaleaceae bacterium]|nr:hypothetical protein [Defluviitaleaceae bacterium]